MSEAIPEKKGDLYRVADQLRLSFQLNGKEDRIFFRADAENHSITIGVKCLFRLWIHAYAFACACYALAEHGYPEVTEVPDTEEMQAFELALELLGWAVEREIDIHLPKFGYSSKSVFGSTPPKLPPRFSKLIGKSQQDAAESIFRNALAFILYHELAHISLNHLHCTGPAGIEQEKEADRTAANWLLDCRSLDPSTKLMRIAGITVGLAWLVVKDVHFGPGNVSQKAPGYDRLFQILSESLRGCDDQEGEAVWYFVTLLLILYIYFSQRRRVNVTAVEGSWKDRANHLIDMISKETW